MYTRTLKEEHVFNLRNGIPIYKIKDFVNYNTTYSNDDINNLCIICRTSKTRVYVPTEDITDILKIWGRDDIYSGQLVLTRDMENGTSHVKIKSDITCTHYVCEPRIILKDLNTLSKNIIGARNLENRKTNTGRYQVSTQILLMAILGNNQLNATRLLHGTSTDAIVKKLKSLKFRYIYKLIHPETTFIKRGHR